MPNYDVSDHITSEQVEGTLFRPSALTSGNRVHRWVDIGSALTDETDTGAGDLSLRVLSGTNMVVENGFALAASAGDLATWRVPLEGVDLTQSIYITPMFIHNSTDADTPIFKFAYSTVAFDNFNETAVPAAAAHPAATDATETYSAITCSTTTAAIHWIQAAISGAGIIPANTLPSAPYMYCTLEADNLGSASASEIGIGGFVMSYYPSFASFNLQ